VYPEIHRNIDTKITQSTTPHLFIAERGESQRYGMQTRISLLGIPQGHSRMKRR